MVEYPITIKNKIVDLTEEHVRNLKKMIEDLNLNFSNIAYDNKALNDINEELANTIEIFQMMFPETIEIFKTMIAVPDTSKKDTIRIVFKDRDGNYIIPIPYYKLRDELDNKTGRL